MRLSIKETSTNIINDLNKSEEEINEYLLTTSRPAAGLAIISPTESPTYK
jgi:hypothetical protein